jgi:hypothetical protein
VRSYQAQKQDSRVLGVVLASGAVRAETRPTDPDQLAEAKRLMASGEGDALIRDPKRSFPSYISAATFLDIANAPPELKDFFGVQPQTLNPGVARIRCPLLAFFGTRGDVGNEEDLELVAPANSDLLDKVSVVLGAPILTHPRVYSVLRVPSGFTPSPSGPPDRDPRSASSTRRATALREAAETDRR